MTSLTPALELAPGRFSLRERPSPGVSMAENPQGWLQYWSDSLEDAGIVGLTPWHPGSWLVPLRAISDAHVLRTILLGTFDDFAERDADEIGPLRGGFVLSHGEAHILPGCCGDLANLENWQQAAAHADDCWTMVWIGHPWTHVRASGDLLQFAQPADESVGAADLVECIRLQRQSLVKAIDEAARELDLFADQLLPIIRGFKPRAVASRFVNILVRGHGHGSQ
jgi:hypothetical protein